MDYEDYESWIISVFGVEFWIELLNCIEITPEFENISFLPEDT